MIFSILTSYISTQHLFWWHWKNAQSIKISLAVQNYEIESHRTWCEILTNAKFLRKKSYCSGELANQRAALERCRTTRIVSMFSVKQFCSPTFSPEPFFNHQKGRKNSVNNGSSWGSAMNIYIFFFFFFFFSQSLQAKYKFSIYQKWSIQ